ncbi:DndE family protein [Pseudidiomarina donghaiensis]|jgi:DNA sulfur modification protein DndE|uniref:DndE family protein n=1 Tax=Pseudidiomarina donghaiensis TaxID=519452 RepID=UPI003A974996
MLPNTLWLTKDLEDRFKMLKQKTGVSPNIMARIAFFRSLEQGFECDLSIECKLNGTLKLDRLTWLGATELATNIALKKCYPDVTDARSLHKIWAMHVESGASIFHNIDSLPTLLDNLSTK